MENLNRDIKVLNEYIDNWTQMWPRTNEDLNMLFKYIDVKDKDIYSVLSSSDFLFYSLLEKAKNVDTFDVNPITYRYYFLRKWLLDFGLLYADKLDKDDISYIINNHNISKKDEGSINFWNYYLSLINGGYFYDSILFDNQDDSHGIYCYDRINELQKILLKTKLNFDNIDICSFKEHNKNNSYDLIYLSNLLDYNMAHKEKLVSVSEILRDLLKNNGVIISSQMPKYDGYKKNIKTIFSNNFYFEELFTENDKKSNVLYYALLKK